MTCNELLQILHEYVGGELVVDKHKTVQVHLDGCENCVRLVETYTHTIRFAKSLPKCGKLPAEVEARLRRVIEPELTKTGEK